MLLVKCLFCSRFSALHNGCWFRNAEQVEDVVANIIEKVWALFAVWPLRCFPIFRLGARYWRCFESPFSANSRKRSWCILFPVFLSVFDFLFHPLSLLRMKRRKSLPKCLKPNRRATSVFLLAHVWLFLSLFPVLFYAFPLHFFLFSILCFISLPLWLCSFFWMSLLLWCSDQLLGVRLHRHKLRLLHKSLRTLR